MPLVNSPTLTPKKLAANRANAELSRGLITLEGLIRVRDANIKHGAYPQNMGEARRWAARTPRTMTPRLATNPGQRMRLRRMPCPWSPGLLIPPAPKKLKLNFLSLPGMLLKIKGRK
jgi:hypothetical protein